MEHYLAENLNLWTTNELLNEPGQTNPGVCNPRPEGQKWPGR